MILAVYLLLFFLCVSNAGYSATCNNSTKSKTTFKPSEDGVAGRYVVEWCTEAKNTTTDWNLMLIYLNDNRSIDKCKKYSIWDRGVTHSRVSEPVKLDLNCTNICLAKSLDLIFSGCYAIKNCLKLGKHSQQNVNTLHHVNNTYKSASYFNNSKAKVRTQSYGDVVYAHWFLGYIPVTDYDMTLCKLNHTEKDGDEECQHIRSNCTSVGSGNEVECHLWLPLGRYRMEIIHTAPWTDGSIFGPEIRHYKFYFDHPEAVPGFLTIAEQRGPSTTQVWAMCGAALALVVVALVALAAWRSALSARVRKRVLRHWLHRYEEFNGDPALKAGSKGSCILLLYARDCAPATRAIKLLRDMLEIVAPGQVYDIFSPHVAALSASAPCDWVRGAIEQPGTRVVLVQTPAFACLYAAEMADAKDTLTLQEPLLPGRVSYKTPHFGDTLLQYTLRLMKHTAHRQTAYHKYYIATLSDLPAETIPHVVPFRRYELPAATGLLLRDLTPTPDPIPAPDLTDPPGVTQLTSIITVSPVDLSDARLQHKFQEFTSTLVELVKFIRNNPDYLQDQLTFL